MNKLFIGTSGFSYSHWKDGIFYPKKMPESKHLEYFAEHFNSVELNNSFYRLPQEKTFLNWQKRTPPGFLFSVKASGFITHIKKLNQCQSAWDLFLKRSLNLGPKLGPFLFQFPPSWKINFLRLKNFIEMINKDDSKFRFVFEFRHPSWFSPEIFQFLKKYKNISLCLADSPYWPARIASRPSRDAGGFKTEKISGDFVYIRMHGGKILYGSNYSEKELKQLAGWIKKYLNQKLDVYCYFNNDACGFAVRNAERLAQLCGR